MRHADRTAAQSSARVETRPKTVSGRECRVSADKPVRRSRRSVWQVSCFRLASGAGLNVKAPPWARRRKEAQMRMPDTLAGGPATECRSDGLCDFAVFLDLVKV